MKSTYIQIKKSTQRRGSHDRNVRLTTPNFKHSIRKKITKNGGTAYMEYRPIANIEVPFEELGNLKCDYIILANSNFGLGIDIVEIGLFNFLKFSIRKNLGKGIFSTIVYSFLLM